MPTTESEIVHGFAWEGPLGVATALGLWTVLAVAFAWLLWRERYAAGTLSVVGFWILRVIAVALVLWMLLEPTNLTRHITSSPQSIAVLVDRSQSMGVVDPAGQKDDLRWNLAARSQQSESRGSFLLDCDRAAVALQMAVDHLAKATNAIELHRPMRIVRQQSDSVADAMERAAVHLQHLNEQLSSSDTPLASRAGRIRDQLKGPIRDTWEECDRLLGREQVATPMELTARLSELGSRLTGSQRRLTQLVRDAADRVADVVPEKEFRQTATMSRAEKVAQVMQPLEEQTLSKLENSVRVKRIGFADVPTPIADGEDWDAPAEPAAIAVASNEEPNSRSDNGQTAGHVGPTTDLTAALTQLSRDAASESIKSIYLITDGGHNHPDTLAPQEAAASLSDIPVFVVPIGNDQPLRDLILHRVDAPTTVIEKDSIAIDAIVTAFSCQGDKTLAILKRNGEQIDQKTLEFDRKRIDRHVDLSSFRGQAGSTRI